MKCFLLVASVALASAAGPSIKLSDVGYPAATITYKAGVLTVPQHCRAECSTLASADQVAALQAANVVLAAKTTALRDMGLDHMERIAVQAAFIVAQAAENKALGDRITALATKLTALATKHGDDIKDSDNADAAFAAADATLTAAVEAVAKLEGPQGDTGAAGAAGASGATGADGNDGDMGAKGDKGDKGDTGADGTVLKGCPNNVSYFDATTFKCVSCANCGLAQYRDGCGGVNLGTCKPCTRCEQHRPCQEFLWTYSNRLSRWFFSGSGLAGNRNSCQVRACFRVRGGSGCSAVMRFSGCLRGSRNCGY